eukprot:scaffold7340_cov266-Pinguiococcus_pyrenoidosus.AAC.40
MTDSIQSHLSEASDWASEATLPAPLAVLFGGTLLICLTHRGHIRSRVSAFTAVQNFAQATRCLRRLGGEKAPRPLLFLSVRVCGSPKDGCTGGGEGGIKTLAQRAATGPARRASPLGGPQALAEATCRCGVVELGQHVCSAP